MNLTPHFTLEELSCHCPRCKGKTPPPKIVANLKSLALAMEKFRTKAGNKPIHVHCAYRCPAHNRELNGTAKNSFHMAGYACDFDISGMTDQQMFELAAGISVAKIPRKPVNNIFTGVGYYPGQHFCHVDIAPLKPRPNTWKK